MRKCPGGEAIQWLAGKTLLSAGGPAPCTQNQPLSETGKTSPNHSTNCLATPYTYLLTSSVPQSSLSPHPVSRAKEASGKFS